MFNYKFENLFGVTYNSGNLQFSKTNPDLLYSPIGNKISIFDIKNGSSHTLDIESRSNIHLIEITNKNLLVAIDVDGFCIIVNLIKNIVIGHFNFHEKAHSIASSPCGKLLAVGIKNGVQVYELPYSMTKQIEPLVIIKSYTALHSDSVKSITWSKDSRFILTGSKDMSVRLLNLFKIKDYSPFLFTGHKKKIINAVFSEDNEKIFSISADGTLFIWKYINEKSEEFVKRSQFNNKKIHQKRSKNDSNNNDDDLAYMEEDLNEDDVENNNTKDNRDDKEEYNYHYSEFEKKIETGRFILEKKQQFILNNSRICKASINLKSNILVICLENGIFSIYDLLTLENKYTLQITDNKINTVSINNNGLWIAFGSRKSEQLLVWEWKSESYVFKNQGHNFDISAIALSTDSSVLASGGQDGRIKIWDTSSSACLCTFSNHSSKVTDIKFPIAKINMFVSCSIDGTVRAYDLVKQVNFRTMTTPEPTLLNCIGIDHTGEIVCAGASDPYSIYVWNLKTGDIVDILSGHSAPISCLSFSISKDLLISGSWDKTVRTWSIYSKRGDYEVFECNSEVLSVDLSPDNKEFAASTLKGEIYSFDLENGSLKNILDCQRDIWGGRRKDDRITHKNNPINKHFNSISYNLSGNLILAGGNSPYVCLYDINFQILLKKFKLTSNRSLDGILHILNSGANTTDLDNDVKDYDSNDSEWEKDDKGVVSINKQIKQGKKFNLPIKITKVLFSYSNRSFYIASSEGVFAFSLDVFNSNTAVTSIENIGSSLILDEDVSPQMAVIAYLSNNYQQAITYAIALQSTDLLNKFISGIDIRQVELVVKKLPLSCVIVLCDYFIKKIDLDGMLELNLCWILSILKTRYSELKTIKDKKLFVGFNKVLSKYYNGLVSLTEENCYTLDYVLDQC